MICLFPDSFKKYISKLFNCKIDRGYSVTCDDNFLVPKSKVKELKTVKPVKAIDYVIKYKLKDNKRFYLVGTRRDTKTDNVLYVVKDTDTGISLSLSETLFKLLFDRL